MTNQVQPVANAPVTVKSLIQSDSIKGRLNEILGKNAPSFISSVITIVSQNKNLAECEPNSVVMAAMMAATLDLPINSNLGFAYIVPYSKQAQFQMGWKGFVQLAIRTGQYKTINVTPVYANQLEGRNNLSGEIILNDQEPEGEAVGYLAYYKTIAGFEKMLYMNVRQIREHAQKYSKSFHNASGQWKQNFEAMAMKTVLKLLLSKYGMLSIEMRTAVVVDQGVIKNEDGTDIEFVDSNTASEPMKDAVVVSSEPIQNDAGAVTQNSGKKLPNANEL
jgi:recombination protein RecT